MFVLPGYKITHHVLLMWKITACFHAVNTETVSTVCTCRLPQKCTGLCMGVLLNGHFPLSLCCLKKTRHLLRWNLHSLSGNTGTVGIASIVVAAWPYKPYRTGLNFIALQIFVLTIAEKCACQLHFSRPNTSVFWIRWKSV